MSDHTLPVPEEVVEVVAMMNELRPSEVESGRPLIPLLGCFYLLHSSGIVGQWIFAPPVPVEQDADEKDGDKQEAVEPEADEQDGNEKDNSDPSSGSLDCCDAKRIAAMVPKGYVLIGTPLFHKASEENVRTGRVLLGAAWALYEGKVRKVRAKGEVAPPPTFYRQTLPGDDSYCSTGLCPHGEEHRQNCERVEYLSWDEFCALV